MHHRVEKNIAGIDCLLLSPKSAASDSLHFVLMHGYGANLFDLGAISQVLDPNAKHTWIFPNGILGLDFGAGFEGRAWFPLAIQEWINLAERGRITDITVEAPPGIDDAANALARLLAELNIPAKKMILGGFSQGAIMAFQIAMQFNLDLKALWLWSPALVNRYRLNQFMEKPSPSNYPILVSHGTQDVVLPFPLAQALVKLLQDGKRQVEFVDFFGGHEIPPVVMQRCAAQLKSFV